MLNLIPVLELLQNLAINYFDKLVKKLEKAVK